MGRSYSAASSVRGRPGQLPSQLGQDRTRRSQLYKIAAGFVFASVILDLKPITGGGTNLGSVLLIGVAFVLILIHLGNRGNPAHRLTLMLHDWAYLASVGIMVASMAWSLSAYATFMAVVPLIVLWVASLFLSSLPVEEAVRLVLIAAIVVCILSLIAIPLFGQDAYQPNSSTGSPELRGVFHHQLRLGAFVALALGLMLMAQLNGDLPRVFDRYRSWIWVGAALFLVVLYLSRTRLYAAAAVFALAAALLLSRQGSRKWVTVWIGLAGAVPIYMGFSSILAKLEESGFDTGLTGRTRTWARTLGAITEDTQLLGHGFGTFKMPEFDYLFSASYRPDHAHSSYIQAYFETGAIGFLALVALVVAQVVVSWRFSVRCHRYSYSLFLVLYTALGSLTGLNYAGSLSAMICLTLLFLAIESRMKPAPVKPLKGAVRRDSPMK